MNKLKSKRRVDSRDGERVSERKRRGMMEASLSPLSLAQVFKVRSPVRRSDNDIPDKQKQYKQTYEKKTIQTIQTNRQKIIQNSEIQC